MRRAFGRRDNASAVATSQTDAEATIRSILTDLFPDAEVSDVSSDAPLTDALDIDSMAQIDVVLEIERRTGIHVPDEDIEGLTTIGVAAEYLADHLNQAAPDGHD
jgi:acyl carrier protein